MVSLSSSEDVQFKCQKLYKGLEVLGNMKMQNATKPQTEASRDSIQLLPYGLVIVLDPDACLTMLQAIQ